MGGFMELQNIINKLGLDINLNSGKLSVSSPIDGKKIGTVREDTEKSLHGKIKDAHQAFLLWQNVPAPKRGEIIRIFGDELRKYKEQLGQVVTIECGKILEEGKGEVQEMIDICDFAVGLSRIIGGITLPSERYNHVMQENWLPLGVVGVVSAFNFPVAVWAWNFALAIICGNSVVWKPSEKTPISALVCAGLFYKAIKKSKINVPSGILEVVIGKAKIGEMLVNNKQVNLISATGSSRMGSQVGPAVAKRFGRSLLELGGNNAVVITPSANLNVALSSVIFGAVGTAGQRCTTTRRVFVHDSIYEKLFAILRDVYSSLVTRVGSPLDKGIIIGPLIDKQSYNNMQNALKSVKKLCAEVFGGERVLLELGNEAYYVNPALVKSVKQYDIIKQETFAPILYVMPYQTLEEVIEMHNDVPQGLSSAIFTNDLREAELFKKYSDCGIVNVNIGTSGAEIGGAFGGEKETGGGRESGSDAWKAYMRRQTSTTYYGLTPPELAQGIDFGLDKIFL